MSRQPKASDQVDEMRVSKCLKSEVGAGFRGLARSESAVTSLQRLVPAGW